MKLLPRVEERRKRGNCRILEGDAVNVLGKATLFLRNGTRMVECVHLLEKSQGQNGRWEKKWLEIPGRVDNVFGLNVCCNCYQKLRQAGVAPVAGTWEKTNETVHQTEETNEPSQKRAAKIDPNADPICSLCGKEDCECLIGIEEDPPGGEGEFH